MSTHQKIFKNTPPCLPKFPLPSSHIKTKTSKQNPAPHKHNPSQYPSLWVVLTRAIHSLPAELLDQIIAPFTGQLKKLECTKCGTLQCTCYDPRGTDTWAYIIARNVTVLAAPNRACKFSQAIATCALYRCPMPWSHQGSWYLARTLIDRPDLAAMVEFLVLGEYQTPILGVLGHPRPNRRPRFPAPTLRNGGIFPRTPGQHPTSSRYCPWSAAIWDNGGVLPEEVVAYYDILRPTITNLKDYYSTDVLKRRNSVPVDLLVSVCPNVETLEMNKDAGPAEPVGPGETGLWTWGPHQNSFKKLKTVKI